MIKKLGIIKNYGSFVKVSKLFTLYTAVGLPTLLILPPLQAF